jgi:hypothetical protein
VLLRSLDPDPDRRHPDVGTLAADLAEALPRTVVRDRPTLVTEPLGHAAPGRRRPPVLLTLICLLVLGAAFAASYAVTSLVR